jgi:hypothetical protein
VPACISSLRMTRLPFLCPLDPLSCGKVLLFCPLMEVYHGVNFCHA